MLVRLDISGCYIISESLARTVFAKLLLVVSVNIDADLKRKKTEQQWKNEVGSTGKNTDIWHHHTHTHIHLMNGYEISEAGSQLEKTAMLG